MNKTKTLKICLGVLISIATIGCKQSIVNREVNKKVNSLHQNALTCLEIERTTRQQVEEFFFGRPNTPYYKHLLAVRDNIDSIIANSNQFSNNDKVKHCFVGYRIAQRWDRPTGVFTGFYKEAQDVGDCRSNTRFEIEDQVATIIGTSFFQNQRPIADCHQVNTILARRTEAFLAQRDEANKKRKEILARFLNHENQMGNLNQN